MSDVSIAPVLEHFGADLHRVREVGWQPVKCPFHDDRQASASVNLDKGAFRCHACEARGNAITLVMTHEGLDYQEAVAFIEGLGVKIEGVKRTETRRRPTSRWRDRLFD